MGKDVEGNGCDSSLLNIKCIIVIVRILLMPRHTIATRRLDALMNTTLRPLLTLAVDVLPYRNASKAER
jgi:hypothetical protein